MKRALSAGVIVPLPAAPVSSTAWSPCKVPWLDFCSHDTCCASLLLPALLLLTALVTCRACMLQAMRPLQFRDQRANACAHTHPGQLRTQSARTHRTATKVFVRKKAYHQNEAHSRCHRKPKYPHSAPWRWFPYEDGSHFGWLFWVHKIARMENSFVCES